MTDSNTLLQGKLVAGESLVEVIDKVKLRLAFVPVGEPMANDNPPQEGTLALTSRRLIVQWNDSRFRTYSTLAVYALAERQFDPDSLPKWPYQAVLVLSGGLSLIVQTTARDAQSGEALSRFLTRVLFSLGKRDSDIANLAAKNAYLEQLRRQSEASRDDDVPGRREDDNK